MIPQKRRANDAHWLYNPKIYIYNIYKGNNNKNKCTRPNIALNGAEGGNYSYFLEIIIKTHNSLIFYLGYNSCKMDTKNIRRT